MRTAILRSVVLAGTFVTGVVCGLLLRSPIGATVRFNLPSAAGIGIGFGTRGRRRRPEATRPAASPAETTEGDESWDTYQPDAETDETGDAE